MLKRRALTLNRVAPTFRRSKGDIQAISSAVIGLFLARLAILAGLAVALGNTYPARAAVIAYDSFVYATGSSLAGQNGGSGFSGAWYEGGYNVSQALTTVSSASPSYPLLATSGNALITLSTSYLNGIERNLATPISSGTIYLSCLLTPQGTLGQGNGGGFFGLYLHGTGNDLFMGGGSDEPYGINLRGGSDAVYSTSQEVVGQTEFLVLKAQLQLSGNDVFTLYTDPTPGASEPSTGTVINNITIGTLDSLVIYSGGAFSMGDLLVGTSYANVTPSNVPLVPPGVFAWSNSGTGWNVPSNWGGTVPSGTDAALFNLGSYTYQPSLTAPASVGVLWSTDSGSLAITGSALTINSATINGNASTGIEMDPGSGAMTISSSLALGGPQTWLNNSSNALTVAGNVANSGNTLTIAGSGSTTISGGIGGSGGMTKIGAGLLTMTGSNTYSGTTTVNQGTLKLDFSAAGTPTSNIINDTAVTLGGGNLVIQGKASAANSQSFNGLTINAGASSLVAISGSSGTVSLSVGGVARSAGGTIDFTLPASGGIATTQNTNGPGVMVDASSYWTAYATVNGGSTWATISNGQIVGLTTYSDTNAFPGFYVGTTLITQSLSPGSGAAYTGAITFNTHSTTMTLTGVNWLASDGGLLVTPTATGTVITGGSIQCGGGNSLILFDYGSLSVASAIVDNNAGSTLTLSGTGTTTLTGTNTYSGATYINNGAMVQLGNGGNTGTLGLASIVNNGTLVFNRSNNVVQGTDFGGPISGAGSVIQNGGDRLVFNANNTYIGTTTISAGTLQLGDGISSNGSVGGNIADNSTLAFANPTAQTFSGTIGGSGQVAILGPGQLTLSGSNTYTGSTTVNQGTLIVKGSLASLVTVNSGGTLGGTGFLGSVTVSPSGAIAPGNTLGTLTMTGSLILSAGAVSDYLLDTPSTSSLISCNSLSLNGQQFTDFSFTPTGNFVPGNYDLIQFGSISGSLGATTTGTIDGIPASLSIQGNDLVLSVPEPSTRALLGAGVLWLIGWAWRARRRARRTAPVAQRDGVPILAFPAHTCRQIGAMRRAA